MIAGPYRFVRNPMALAGVTQAAAVGLMLGSWLVVAYAVIGSSLWNHVVRPGEEADPRPASGSVPPLPRRRALLGADVPGRRGDEAGTLTRRRRRGDSRRTRVIRPADARGEAPP